MQKSKIVMACFVSVLGSGLWASTVSTADIYKNRCANCHGDAANGVPKLMPKKDLEVNKMAGAGVVSGAMSNIHGAPLNHLSEEDLLVKLQNLRNEDHDATSPHSVMRKNLEAIEKREGKISDEEMAKFIYMTFGPGSKK